MLNNIKTTNYEYLKVLVLFLPVLLYNPLYFRWFVQDTVRITLFITLCCYLFFRSLRFTNRDLVIATLLIAYSSLAIYTNFNNFLNLKVFAGYALTIIFGWALYRYLLENKKRVEMLITLYSKFFYLVVISSVIALK